MPATVHDLPDRDPFAADVASFARHLRAAVSDRTVFLYTDATGRFARWLTAGDLAGLARPNGWGEVTRAHVDGYLGAFFAAANPGTSPTSTGRCSSSSRC